MTEYSVQRRRPGKVRDAILLALIAKQTPQSPSQIAQDVSAILGPTPASSVRSYLTINTPELFVREARGLYSVQPGLQIPIEGLGHLGSPTPAAAPLERVDFPEFSVGSARMVNSDCIGWLQAQPDGSLHAVVTDPPYGLHEYTPEQQAKLRKGEGGVWRIPPSFDGHKRSPLPRFTTLTPDQLDELDDFFCRWGRVLLPKLVPGANVVVASNPLLSYIVASALARAGFERRGELVRLVMTMRGGDRPKAAHEEFSGVSVMPRSMWEPWLIFRRPLEGRVQDNLRKWKTGGFRRPEAGRPFGDVIRSAPTNKSERALAPHPSLKPQSFLRAVVRGVLPLGEGTVLDPFAGSGSTLAAAEAIGYKSVGVEEDPHFFELSRSAIEKLAALK